MTMLKPQLHQYNKKYKKLDYFFFQFNFFLYSIPYSKFLEFCGCLIGHIIFNTL